MLSAAGDAEIALWDLNTWKVKTSFYGHEGDAACIRFPMGVPGSPIFCTSSSDGTVRAFGYTISINAHISLSLVPLTANLHDVSTPGV